MRKYLALSDRSSRAEWPALRDAGVLIWPESAFPVFLTREKPTPWLQIADLLPKGTVLITGAVRAPDQPPGMRIARTYDSIYVIDHDGSVLSVYDKLHLVPFGEYLPFQDLMEKLGFSAAHQGPGQLRSGERRRSLEIPGAPRALPLILMRLIFPATLPPATIARAGSST